MNVGLGISFGGDDRWWSVPPDMLKLVEQGKKQPALR